MRIISDGTGRHTYTYDDDGNLIKRIIEAEIFIPVSGPNKVQLTFSDKVQLTFSNVELDIPFDIDGLTKLKEKLGIDKEHVS